MLDKLGLKSLNGKRLVSTKTAIRKITLKPKRFVTY